MPADDLREQQWRPLSQRGIAFITAILIMALASIIGFAVTERTQIAIRQASNMLHADQAFQYNLSGEAWAKVILLRDLEEDSRTGYIDSLHEYWSYVLPPTNVEGGRIAGEIIDLQGRFNINNLLFDHGKEGESSPSQQLFTRLLTILELDPELSNGVIDWLDRDSVERYPAGAEDGHYSGQEPPYLTANRPLADISELRLIAGIDSVTLARLAPHLTTLPTLTRINVNTASRELLMASDPIIDELLAERIVSLRRSNPFQSVAELIERLTPLLPEEKQFQHELTRLVDVASNHFMVTSQVERGGVSSRLATTLYRSKSGNVALLSRRRGLLK